MVEMDDTSKGHFFHFLLSMFESKKSFCLIGYRRLFLNGVQGNSDPSGLILFAHTKIHVTKYTSLIAHIQGFH